MHLSISEIRSHRTLQQSEELDPGQLLGGAPAYISFRHPVSAQVTANLSDPDIIVNGHVSTTITLNCGRCLENFEKPIESEFQQVFDGQGEWIDVTNDIRESVFIDLPLHAVCREDCKGFCQRCGINRNRAACRCQDSHTDPRWDKLKNIRYQ